MELSKRIQMFYKNVIESSSDEESNDDSELMIAATMLLYEHTSRPVYRGSFKGRKASVKRNRGKGHYQLYLDYFIIPSQSLMHKHSGATTGCQGSCS
jgi:hypothetical protein